MMAGDRVPLARTGSRAFHNILQGTVVLLHVEVGGSEVVHMVAQVLGNGERLEEYFGEDDRASNVEKHPAVAQVAIVAYPDGRLGERACAVIVPKAGQTIDFAAMTEFLKLQKLALQYIPERLVVRDAMPATPSGKIQKFRLREMLREGNL